MDEVKVVVDAINIDVVDDNVVVDIVDVVGG